MLFITLFRFVVCTHRWHTHRANYVHIGGTHTGQIMYTLLAHARGKFSWGSLVTHTHTLGKLCTHRWHTLSRPLGSLLCSFFCFACSLGSLLCSFSCFARSLGSLLCSFVFSFSSFSGSLGSLLCSFSELSRSLGFSIHSAPMSFATAFTLSWPPKYHRSRLPWRNATGHCISWVRFCWLETGTEANGCGVG